LHIKSTGTKEAVILLGNTLKAKNSVYVKAVGSAAAGVDMLIGSTAGAKSYGRLVMNFQSDMTFLGNGLTTFKRGNTIFQTGTVGFGDRAAGGKHGITVATAAKPGHLSNDIALKRGSLHLHGGIYDTSSKGKWFIDMDKGGHVKSLNIASQLGVGTTLPKSPFGDTNQALMHMVDTGRPVITLESKAAAGHSTIVMKTGKSQWNIDQADKVLTVSSGKDMLVLDSDGKVGIGRRNNGKYGLNLHMMDGVNNPRNDIALPHGNLRMKGKIYDTFDGGDQFYLDPSGNSNVKDISLTGKLSFKGVASPQYHLELPKGDAHIALGRSLFLNGFGGDSGRITNNAVVGKTGKWALADSTKMASAIELRNTGKIDMYTTSQKGKMNWRLLLGMNGVTGSVYAMGKLGIGTKKPQHTFHMPGGDATASFGNNLFIAGSPAVSHISANAYMKKGVWMIPRKDRYASSIQLKNSGRVDMYGTISSGGAQWKKMFGFDAPGRRVYAFGKLGINTEKPSHTLSIPSGAHHISLGDKMFLNGGGATTRVMGNCYMKMGKYAIQDKSRQAVSVELNSAAAQITFGGTRSKGSDAFLKLFALDFTRKAVVVQSGRLGVKTASPKTAVDVRGHMNLQDASNAGVIYTPASGPGLYLRAADAPGNYKGNQERFFFGNNARAGFGTNKPQAKLHITHRKGDAALPHIKLETAGALQYDIQGTKNGLVFGTSQDAKEFKFRAGQSTPLRILAKGSEASQNGVKYKQAQVMLVPTGGRASIGGAPKSHHNLQLFGAGMLITGGPGANKGTLAFSNDGGGSGFQMDYHTGKILFASLPPMKHLKNKKAQRVHMAITDRGFVGIGTTKPTAALSVKSNSGISVQNTAGAKWTYRTSKDGSLEFTSNRGGFFKVDNQGGMHLSRKQSKYKLEVAGTGMMLAGDSTGKAPLVFNADGGGRGFRMDYFKEKMMLGHGDGSKWHMVMQDNGHIGVGTPAPKSAVHVKHDTGITIEHGSKLQRWSVATKANANLAFSYMKHNHISFTKAGFVGIGTDKPKKQLHVEGDVYVSGKMHVDNYYLKKLAAKVKGAKKPKLERMESTEALIQLDEHVSAKVSDDAYGMVHSGTKATEPVDFANLMTVMHRVVQEHQSEIKQLKARLAVLEAKK
jgi:hypothetical protein